MQRSISLINEDSEIKVTLTIYSNYDKSRIFNSLNIKHNTIKVSLDVFYTSINGLLLHQLFDPSIPANFRLTYEKHETSKGLCGTC